MKSFFLAAGSLALAIISYCITSHLVPHSPDKPAFISIANGQWITLFSNSFDSDFSTASYFEPVRVVTENGGAHTLYATRDHRHPYYLR